MTAIRLRNALVVLIVILFMSMASYSSAAEKPIELKFSQYFSSAQVQSKLCEEWAKRAEKESNGRLRIIIFPDSSLLKGPENWEGTVRGVADISAGWMKGFGKEGMNPYHYGPIAWAATHGTNGAVDCSLIGDELFKTFPPYAEEVRELKMLSTSSLHNLVYFSKNYRISSVEVLKGRTVRCGNKATSDLARYFGGSPLFLTMGEVFLAMQKGTVDIMAGYASNLIANKLGDVSRYVTLTAIPGGGPNIGYVGMNWNAWNKLPPDLQKIIEVTSEWLNKEIRQTRLKEAEDGIAYAKSKGNEILEFSSKEEEKIAQVLKALAKKEAAEMDAKGQKGTEYMELAYKIASKYAKK